jgi:hypothetical protein
MLELSRFLQSYLSVVVYPGHREFFPRNIILVNIDLYKDLAEDICLSFHILPYIVHYFY